MYKMLILMSASVHEQNSGRMLPLAVDEQRKIGYVEGETIEECVGKFNKMVPKGFVEMIKK